MADVSDNTPAQPVPVPLPRARYLTCCCCGDGTWGRQWWNRDAGFGLCVGCIPFVGRNATAADMRSLYGERGVHYDVPDPHG